MKVQIKEEIGFEDLGFELAGVSEEIVRAKNIHQITFTYKTIYKNEIKEEKFKSIETDWMNFEWVDINELNNYEIHPSNVIKMLNNSEFEHLVEEINY